MIKLTKIINITILTLILNLINVGYCEETNIAKHLQDISITVKAGGSSGSGVIFTRTNSNNETVNFVWTAAHVIRSLRSEREVIASDGSKRTIVEFQDAKLYKILIEDGRTVGNLEMNCEVIKYSDSENGQDLALLKLRKRSFIKESVRFFLEDKILEPGVEILHVGSLLGTEGANSLTSGIISQNGRLINKLIYDQFTASSFPGSSGGGLFLHDGRYVAMLTRGAGETFSLGVPIRRIKEWVRKNKLEWAINHSIPLPSDEEINNMPIEDKFGKLQLDDKTKDNSIKTLENKTNSIENIKILIK